MRKVYIPNKSFHDFEPARQFGELVFLTEGIIHNRQNVNHLYRLLADQMRGAAADDLLLVSGMSLLNAVAASILAVRFHRVNFLIFSRGVYVEREVVLSSLADTGAFEAAL